MTDRIQAEPMSKPHAQSPTQSGPNSVDNDVSGGGRPRGTVPTNKWFSIGEDVSKLDKPFEIWSLDQVEAIALSIASQYGPGVDEELFLKAARVLHDPNPKSWQYWEKTFPQLTPDEIRALEREPELRFGDQPWPLKITYFMLFVAAIVQGFNQTATNGANLSWWSDLHKSDREASVSLGTGPTIDFYNGVVASIENGTPLLFGDSNILHFGDQTSLSFQNGTTVDLERGSEILLNDRNALVLRNGTVLPFADVSSAGPASQANLKCGRAPPSGKWLFAAVNAAPYLAASVGCWISDPIINELLFGRRWAIWGSALLIFVSAIGGALAQSSTTLLLWRLALGIGMGCKAAVVPVFAAEIAPPHLRGSLVMNWQVFDSLGLFLGFSANLIATFAGRSAWRWQIGFSAVPALFLLSGASFICWDSPRFLMKHEETFRKRHEEQRPWLFQKLLRPFKVFRPDPRRDYESETFNTLLLIRRHPILAAKELTYAHSQLLLEDGLWRQSAYPEKPMDFSLKSRSGWLRRLKDLAVVPHLRRAVYAAAAVMISQQLCGINLLIFYSSSLFCDTTMQDEESSSIGPLFLSWGIGLTNFLFALPAYEWIESKGRRYLVLSTLPFLGLTLAGAAASFKVEDQIPKQIAVTLFTYLFTMFYAPGLGPVPFTLSAEIFPLEHRMVGMSLAVSLNFLGAGLLALGAPLISSTASLLGGFSCLNLLAFVLVWIYVREVAPGHYYTASRKARPLSLEELFHIFRRSTREHIDYQRLEVFPKTIRRIFHRLSGRPMSEELDPPRLFREWALKHGAPK